MEEGTGAHDQPGHGGAQPRLMDSGIQTAGSCPASSGTECSRSCAGPAPALAAQAALPRRAVRPRLRGARASNAVHVYPSCTAGPACRGYCRCLLESALAAALGHLPPRLKVPKALCIPRLVLPVPGCAPPLRARTPLCSRRSMAVSLPRVQLLPQPPGRASRPLRRP